MWLSARLGSAPTSRRSFAPSACPSPDAQESGVRPYLSGRLTSEPASRKLATRGRSSAFAASIRFVEGEEAITGAREGRLAKKGKKGGELALHDGLVLARGQNYRFRGVST